MGAHTERLAFFAVLATLAFSFAGCTSQEQPGPIQTYRCPTGEIVESVATCPAGEMPEKPCICTPCEEPESGEICSVPEKDAEEPVEPAQPGVPACGNNVCDGNETFGSCQRDCAPTYAYLYEYAEGLNYEYENCDRIGSRTNCWTETTYVERAEPYYNGDSAKPYYSSYNSYMVRIENNSMFEKRTLKIWVNRTSSECLNSYENIVPLDPVGKFYNASGLEKTYRCPRIISIEYLGLEDVAVPLGRFPNAQKFRVKYEPDPKADFPKTEEMLIWKAKAPLASYVDYKFIVQGNVLVPVKTEREWSYIDNQGVEIHVVSNSTLKAYVEAWEFGG